MILGTYVAAALLVVTLTRGRLGHQDAPPFGSLSLATGRAEETMTIGLS